MTPPAGSQLAGEASSVTYDWDTDTLFVVGDEGTSVVQVSKSGALIDSMTLAAGAFDDTEGIAYLGDGRFALVEERVRQVNRFTYVAGGTLQRADVQTVKLGTTIGNVGIEGITNDPFSGGFVAVKEKEPLGIFQTGIDFALGTATNGSPTTENAANLFDPAKLGLSDLSDAFSLSNLRGLTGDDTSHLLVLSQESGKIVNTDRAGTVSSTLTLRGDPGDLATVPEQTHEGVTMDDDGTLYVVDEASGTPVAGSGTSGLWVYRAVDTPPVVVSEVSPTSSDASYLADWFELTNTGTRTADLTGWKVDDDSHAFASAVALAGVTSLAPGESAVFVNGDAARAAAFEEAWWPGGTAPAGLQVGTYSGSGIGLGGSGDEVNVYAADGDRVTGVRFGAATAGVSFDNAAGYGSTVDPLPVITRQSAVGVNGAFAAGPEVGSPGRIANAPTLPPVIVSEVSPWSSGDSSWGADWFELTNTGSSAVDLSGWKIDDSSASLGVAVALSGVSSLAAGASAVFLETATPSTTIAAFKSAWFGAAAPAGLQVGSYTGGGVGLSTGGDGVTLFDAAGQLVTGISFGTATTGRTFDNAAGAGSTAAPFPAVSTLSAVGVNGAFQAGSEIGSPGSIATGSEPPAAHAAFTVPAFAQQAQGTIGAAQAVTVTNDGTAPLTVSRVRIDDADGLSEGDFLVSGESCSDDPIAPGASCKVWVRFAPGRANVTSHATLTLRDDTAAGSSTAALTATSAGLPQGERGADGSDGRDGTDGRDGAQGPAGPTGPQGAPGSGGANGREGAQGATGAAGPRRREGREGRQRRRRPRRQGHLQGRDEKRRPARHVRDHARQRQKRQGRQGLRRRAPRAQRHDGRDGPPRRTPHDQEGHPRRPLHAARRRPRGRRPAEVARPGAAPERARRRPATVPPPSAARRAKRTGSRSCPCGT